MQRIASVVGSLLLAGFCAAQATPHLAGFTFNVAVGATTRNGVLTAAELLGRIDFDEYRGIDETVNGFQVIMQDQDILATPGELFDFFLYAEDPLQPNFPNLTPGAQPGTSALGGATGFAGPAVASPGSTTIGAAILTVNFATPIALGTVTGDVFFAFSVPPAPNWTNDGLSVQISLGANPNFPAPATNTFDLPGPAPVPQNSYGLVNDWQGGGLIYGGSRQLMCDLLTDAPSGVTTAITTQTSYPPSNAAPGTASFFSGLHPDATNGRADNVGYVYFDTGLATGSLVIFVVDFDFFPVPLNLATYVPGSQGAACVGVGVQAVSLAVWAGGSAQNVVTIPANFRNRITGSDVVWDAVAFDAATNTLRGGYCGKQSY